MVQVLFQDFYNFILLFNFFKTLVKRTFRYTSSEPTVTINENPRNFKYVYIPGTETINSSVGGTTYGGYFYSTGKSVNEI